MGILQLDSFHLLDPRSHTADGRWKNHGAWEIWGVPIGFVDSLTGRFSRLSCFLCQNDKKRHSKPFKEIELRDLSMGFIPISVVLYEFVFGWWVTNLSTRNFFCLYRPWPHGPQEIPWDLEDGPLDQVLELHWSGPFRLTRDSSMGFFGMPRGEFRCLVVTGTWRHYDFPIILGMEKSSQLTNSIIFQRGRSTTKQMVYDGCNIHWLMDVDGKNDRCNMI